MDIKPQNSKVAKGAAELHLWTQAGAKAYVDSATLSVHSNSFRAILNIKILLYCINFKVYSEELIFLPFTYVDIYYYCVDKYMSNFKIISIG